MHARMVSRPSDPASLLCPAQRATIVVILEKSKEIPYFLKKYNKTNFTYYIQFLSPKVVG